MPPKQRGGGSPKFGNTSHGHRTTRVTSIRRGGNPHQGGGGGGKKGGGGKGCLVLVFALAGGSWAVVEGVRCMI